MTLHQQSAVSILKALESGRVTSEEITSHLKNRIQVLNPSLKAIIASEECPAPVAKGFLEGLPVTIKDHIHYKNLPCTFGVKDHKDFIPAKNAPIIDQLLENGATILGKTNLPPFAMDFQCNNDLFGTTENPWHLGYTPGGSSGAGCASVAAGLSFLDIGTDLAGSLRIPASFCGVFSLLPTEGALSNEGMMAEGVPPLTYFARSGPIARSAEDLVLGWQAISGKRTQLTSTAAKDLSIDWISDSEGVPVCDRILNKIEETLQEWRNAGVQITGKTLDGFDLKSARKAFGEIVGYETGALIPPIPRLLARLFGKKAANRSPEFIKNILAGYRRNKNSFDRALEEKKRLTKIVENHLKPGRFLLLPVTATSPFKHMKATSERGGSRDYAQNLQINEEDVNYFDALSAFTTPIGLTGLPVVTLPMGLDKHGFPVGAQLVGQRGKEDALLSAATALSALHHIPKCPMILKD